MPIKKLAYSAVHCKTLPLVELGRSILLDKTLPLVELGRSILLDNINSLQIRQRAKGGVGETVPLNAKVFWFIILIFAFWILDYCIASELPRYEIDAQIDTAKHKITATQKVTFTNNSDKELGALYFHIYPHRKYSKNEISFIYRFAGYFKVNFFPEGFQAGDLKIKSAVSQGKTLNYEIQGEDRTILKISLDTALKPGESREISIDFQVDIPHSYGRFGWHKDIITLSRWYPILSALDKDGWHNYPFYIYHQPFFSDAAYYEVKLTLLKEEEVASSANIAQTADNADGTKTLKITTAYPLRDFSLGISKKFLIYSIKDGNIKINSYYLAGNEKRAADAAKHASDLLKFYGRYFGEYPYSEFNIVPSYLGYGGCQSSGLVFMDTRVYKLPGFLSRFFDFLIAHETGHQWFYNMLGADEYREMFLDEGMNSYWMMRYIENKYGKSASVMTLPKSLKWLVPDFSFSDASFARYAYIAKNGLNRPVIAELSSFQEPSSIFAITYGKGAGVIDMLQRQIGEDRFLKFMRRYTREFRFKNISLEEFIRICNEEAGMDLTQFFNHWLKTDKNCDFAVTKVLPDKVVIENKGAISMPVRTKIVYADGSQIIDSWDAKDKFKEIPIAGRDKLKSVEVDPDNTITLDLDRTNNYWPRNLYTKPVALYHGLYEVPVFLRRDSYNLVAGPSINGSSLGLASSLQKPDDNILRLSANYDFSGEAVESTLGYEFKHLFNKQIALGFEIFNYESNEPRQDVSGGKVYLRKELWPVNYGLFDFNDHVTFYLLRDQKLDKTTRGLNGQENVDNFYYRKKDEAVFGLTAFFGRYGTYPDPSYGWKFIPTQEVAGHFLGGKDAFWRTSFELSNYKLIFPKYQHKIASRIKAGWAEPSDKKLFQLGGPDGLRGYSRKTIEGAHMILGSLEYRLPLKSEIKFYFLDNIFCLDTIQAVGFFDAGKAWHSDFSSRDFKKDAGLGLRFHFDLLGFLEKAVVRLDIARAINEPKEGLHFWAGISQAF